MPSEQDTKSKGKMPKRSPAAMKAKHVGTEVLSIRRTRREDILLVLKKGGGRFGLRESTRSRGRGEGRRKVFVFEDVF